MKLLTIGNPKTQKGLKLGYLTAVLHLAPSDLSGYNVCPFALRKVAGEAPHPLKSACSDPCLNTAGRGGIIKAGETTNAIQQARIRRTKMLFEDRVAFMALMVADIKAALRLAARMGLKLAVRPNGTSDLDWTHITDADGKTLFELFPEVQFYDYTKVIKRAWQYLNGSLPSNYHVTLSVHENNRAAAFEYRAMGGNIAAVVAKTASLTDYDATILEWVTDGDDTDLRFLDVKGAMVVLTPKGKAKRDTTGFVIR